jgi:hypothetical protein
VLHRPRATATLLVALLLAAAMPAAAGQAADATPLDKNLLRNAGFETVPTDSSPVPRWTVEGDVRVERFGDRSWPYPAYGKKWGGGKRYLACGRRSGLVRQRVAVTGWNDRTFKLRARAMVDYGGTVGHRLRLSVRAIGSGPDAYAEQRKVMDITHHYKRAMESVTLPLGTKYVEVEVELIRKSGASSCKMVADTVKMFLYRG